MKKKMIEETGHATNKVKRLVFPSDITLICMFLFGILDVVH